MKKQFRARFRLLALLQVVLLVASISILAAALSLTDYVAVAGDAAGDVAAAPRLRLSGELEFGRVMIRITDNGPGIADEVMDQVFVPFFTTKRNGSGIGLSLSRQIMTAHRGEIVLESNGGGTTVSLLF